MTFLSARTRLVPVCSLNERPLRPLVVVFSLLSIFFFSMSGDLLHAAPLPQGQSYRIEKITTQKKDKAFQYVIQGSSRPTFTTYELFDPLRLVIDIADAGLSDEIAFPVRFSSGPVATVQARVLAAKTPSIVRLELFLRDDHMYAVDLVDSNINVVVQQERNRPRQAPEAVVAASRNQGRSSVPLASESGTKTTPSPATGPELVEIASRPGSSPLAAAFTLKFTGPVPSYSKNELQADSAKNPRVYIDIPGVGLANEVQSSYPGSGPVGGIRVSRRTDGVRVVFDSASTDPFATDIRKDANILTVVAAPLGGATGKKAAAASKERQVVPEVAAAADRQPVSGVESLPAATTKKDQFTEAGYKEKRISVDFFKIDLHNVFRLFGEISGKNIVVEESIGGSLTLSLRDVPWDFALEVILNLKDLQKEERFNTIVILPKKKSFYWPEKPKKALAIEEDRAALTIIRKHESPKNLLEAKKMIRQGIALEKQGSISQAISLYAQAYGMWPQNTKIGLRLASLSLMQEKNNARAVHFAKQVIKQESGNSRAAMLAAIGLSNMKRFDEAEKFFGLAVSHEKPPAAVFLNYAAFLENRGRVGAALNQLRRHDALYGEKLDSMVARARLLDKQGKEKQAVKLYRAILLSGFQVPDDLNRYIRGRIALAETKRDTRQGAGR